MNKAGKIKSMSETKNYLGKEKENFEDWLLEHHKITAEEWYNPHGKIGKKRWTIEKEYDNYWNS